VTIAVHTHVHQRTLTDTQAQAGYENAHYRGLRTWLRDEEAAGSNPATPTQVRGPFPFRKAGLFPSVRHPCVKRRAGVGGRPSRAHGSVLQRDAGLPVGVVPAAARAGHLTRVTSGRWARLHPGARAPACSRQSVRAFPAPNAWTYQVLNEVTLMEFCRRQFERINRG
jgi:hypothetical protein